MLLIQSDPLPGGAAGADGENKAEGENNKNEEETQGKKNFNSEAFQLTGNAKPSTQRTGGKKKMTMGNVCSVL